MNSLSSFKDKWPIYTEACSDYIEFAGTTKTAKMNAGDKNCLKFGYESWTATEFKTNRYSSITTTNFEALYPTMTEYVTSADILYGPTTGASIMKEYDPTNEIYKA